MKHKLQKGELVFRCETQISKGYLSTDKSAKCKGRVGTSVSSISIQMANVDLNRSMILGCDQPVCSRTALETEQSTTIHHITFHFLLIVPTRRGIPLKNQARQKQNKLKLQIIPLPRDIEIHILSLLVLHLGKIVEKTQTSKVT